METDMNNTNVVYIDYEKFKESCFATWEEIAKLGQEFNPGTDKRYIYIDNGSDVLGVAHLDSVQTKDFHFYVLEIQEEVWVFNAQLDDRIGLYALLHLLPALGVTCDILLTDNEEIGRSTAQYFKTDKKYKWMFQFDRRGEDVVHYQYGTKFLKKRLKRAGFDKIEYGMKSDIWYLDFLKCCGFNVGVGYEGEHTVWAKANMDIFCRQVDRFVTFYNMFKDLEFVYTAPPPITVSRTSSIHYTDNRVIPPGYSKQYVTGATWSYTYQCWKLPEDTTKQLLELEYCKCGARLFPHNISTTYPSMCKSCAATVFECVGCNGIKDIATETERNLCAECNAKRIQEGNDAFLTAMFCEMLDCQNVLTWTEYISGCFCKECDDKLTWNLINSRRIPHEL
jgi:hypothetical protein